MAATGGEKNNREDEASIGPLLARAHLLRMRGQWDEAVAACSEALRRVPESATACALLGDIYEAQNKLDAAMHWFGMAVEFDPGNRADRAKLDRIVAVQRRALLAEERAAGTLLPRKQEALARNLLFIGGGLFLLLTFAAAFVYFGGLPPEREARVTSPTPRGTVVVPPVPESPASAPPIKAPPAPEPSAPAPPFPAAPAEEVLRAAVARAVPAEIGVTGVQMDPRSLNVTLAIALPASPASESADQTRERVLRATVRSLQAAAGVVPQMRSATIRVSLRTNAAAASLAFVGDAAIASLRGVDPARATEAELRARFTDPWWAGDPRPAFPSTPDNSRSDRGVPAPR